MSTVLSSGLPAAAVSHLVSWIEKGNEQKYGREGLLGLSDTTVLHTSALFLFECKESEEEEQKWGETHTVH